MRGLFCLSFVVFFLTCATTFAVLVPGDIQPDFTLYKFATTQQYNLHNDFAGKIIVLDFFAYWCGPCAVASSELEPNVQQYYAARGGNPAHIPVQVVSVSMDGSSPSSTQAYINSYGVELALDDSSQILYRQHATTGIPRFAIIDCAANTNHKQYEVVWTQTGYGSGLYTSFRSVIDSVTKLISGDATGDGKVDVNDLNKELVNYNKTGMTWSSGDFDGNGVVDINDLNKVLTDYNKYGVTGSGAQPVPEPSTAVLLGIGAFALLSLGWKRAKAAI